MKLIDYLKTNNPGAEYDDVMVDLLERGMKRIYLNHAKKSGADDSMLATLEKLDSMSLGRVVEIIYGDPY